ncbi:ERCC4 domain-containing protein [[Eubacterium] cellulosolvens]
MVRVVVDERERPNVPTCLKNLGLTLDYRLLEEGDYIAAEYAIERKTVRDFISSLYSGRLFDQAYRLGQTYRFAIIIVEGDLYSALEKMKNPKVFWGALVTLSFGYGIRTFFTRDPEVTAELISILAKRPPEVRSRPPAIVKKPKYGQIREGQIVLLQGLPGIGARLAQKLLGRFGTPRNVFLATESELNTRGGLGRAKTAKITDVLDTAYTGLDRKLEQLKLSNSEP